MNTFIVVPAPSCVSKLEFINPAGAIPISGSDTLININQIKAVLSNGVSYTYNQGQMEGLELTFELTPDGLKRETEMNRKACACRFSWTVIISTSFGPFW